MKKLTSRIRMWRNRFGEQYYRFGLHHRIDLRVGDVIQVDTPYEKYNGTYIVQEAPGKDVRDRCRYCDLYFGWYDQVRWCESQGIPIKKKNGIRTTQIKGQCVMHCHNKRDSFTSSVCMLRPPSRYYRAIYVVFKKLDNVLEEL